MRRSDVGKWVAVGLGLMFSVHALGTQVFASAPPGVPEIGPGPISAGIALLAGGVLVLRARRRSK